MKHLDSYFFKSNFGKCLQDAQTCHIVELLGNLSQICALDDSLVIMDPNVLTVPLSFN